VLDQALDAATVVPLRLCTIYRDRARVERLLADERIELGDALARLRGRAEWGLKLFVDRARLTDAVRDHAGDAAGESSGAAEYLQRKRRDRDLRERVDRMVITCAQESYARLEGLAAGARTNPVQHPDAHGRATEMALNAVYLVDAERRDEVAAAAAELRAEYEPLGFELELTGPWPAYNFASPTPAPAR
jgi:Gas vesicle synthesis protein GvpL/GvpF